MNTHSSAQRAAQCFGLTVLRLRLEARQALDFRSRSAANFLRGAFGKALYRGNQEAYQKFFAPSSEEGPSGLRDLPRPFVFRVADLEGSRFRVGEKFELGVNLFERQAADLFVAGVSEMEQARLDAIVDSQSVSLSLEPGPAADRVRVHFLTPTEIKGADRPEFGPLFGRIRDRVSTLRALYGSMDGAGPLEIDFAALGERARRVQMTSGDLRHVDAERLSRHTGQRHPIGGFIGTADYRGDLGEFTPYLEAARYTGVGRQTVWGKGQIAWETF